MKSKHRKTLELIFSRPTPSSVKWPDLLALFVELGGEVTEREGSRVAIYLFNQIRVLHKPHPTPDVDKGSQVFENGLKKTE
ncbi:putative HigA-like protein [Advenella mimigardefordensis DPN7]|uniref:Putative HigA-like protein n=1 Tax=Advenella mimigardefordensis (strain DSM 17166 / LMG 22922 / DPN7) TaxID=1247726 RepID=W0PDF7_ADVMD|nr:putative HigA-like protein [Advenella mimigardefordensis DPN7]